MCCWRWPTRGFAWREETNMSEALPSASTVELTQNSKNEDRVSVAPNWKLVWWRFRKNKLAVISAGRAHLPLPDRACPGLLCHPGAGRNDREALVHPAPGNCLPSRRPLHVRACDRGQANTVTLRMEWTVDQSQRIGVRLFAKGYRIQGARAVHVGPPPHRSFGPDASRRLLPAGHRPPRPRSMVAPHVRHPDLDDRRSDCGAV